MSMQNVANWQKLLNEMDVANVRWPNVIRGWESDKVECAYFSAVLKNVHYFTFRFTEKAYFFVLFTGMHSINFTES